MDQRSQGSALEQAFDALDPEAREFHLGLKRHPVKTSVQLRRLLGLVPALRYTRDALAIARALEFAAYSHIRELSACRMLAPAASHAHSADSTAAKAD